MRLRDKKIERRRQTNGQTDMPKNEWRMKKEIK